MGVNDFFKASGQRAATSSAAPADAGVIIKEKHSSEPWVERYRPKKIDELVYQDEVVAVLKKCVNGADLPNLLFYGPPGTGKTSAAVALCHQLFPTPTLYKSRVLEMNASDERGIDVVRHRIKDFAHLAVGQGKAIVALKIVILDEADAMTAPAQAALRRTMESESVSTRFFLICNYVTRIIEPLASRCAKFRFKPLSVDSQRQRLLMICENEGVVMDAVAIDELVGITGGDLRKSITLLQSMASGARSIDSGGGDTDEKKKERKRITAQDVREMSGYVPEEEVNALMASAQSGNLKNLVQCVQKFTKCGFSSYQVMSQLADVLLDNNALEARHKTKIFEKLGVCEKRLLDGADEYLQLLDLLLLVQGCFFELDN